MANEWVDEVKERMGKTSEEEVLAMVRAALDESGIQYQPGQELAYLQDLLDNWDSLW